MAKLAIKNLNEINKNSVNFSLSNISTTRSGPRSARSLVIKKIYEILSSGELSPGQFFPSERQLARQLNVHRLTVASALAYFENEGFLRKTETGRRIILRLASKANNGNGVLSDAILFFTVHKLEQNIPLESGWASSVAFGAIHEAIKFGRKILVFFPSNLTEDAISQILETPPAGFLLDVESPPKLIELAKSLFDKGIPGVCIEEPLVEGADLVISDHEKGAYQVAKSLIQKGRKNFAIVYNEADKEFLWLKNRLKGYLKAISEAGLKQPIIIDQFHDFNLSTLSKEDWITYTVGKIAPAIMKNTDSILSATDGYVPWLAEACRRLGKKVHKDVSIAGYDNYWQHIQDYEYFDIKTPPLITVDKQNHILGITAFHILSNRISGKHSERIIKTIEPQIIKISKNNIN